MQSIVQSSGQRCLTSVTGPLYDWEDITDNFFYACKGLALGELLHDDTFGLFEAMSAIEMMDPKMDAGMLCNQNGGKKALNFEQALKSEKIKIDDTLTMAEQIGIIDSTFACIVTWLEGHSLAQTVFTNLYLHEPYEVENRCIKAFSLCVLKLVDLVRDYIGKAAVFEEEDFQPMLYGYKLASDLTEARAVGMMKEVEDDIQRIVKNTRNKQGMEWELCTQDQHKLAVGLHSRIKFFRLLYQALLSYGKVKGANLEDAQKFLQQCDELLPVLNDTVKLGIAAEPQTESNNSGDYPTVMGFEPLVNQRLLPPTFPRYTKIKSREEAFAYFDSLLGRMRTVNNVVQCSTFHWALDFFVEFSKTLPCVLSRSVLQLLYLPHSLKVIGIHPMLDVLREDVRIFVGPPILTNRSLANFGDAQARGFVDSFLHRCVRPFSQLIQLCGHNRARQRDKLVQILEDLSNLQEQTEKLDSFLVNVTPKYSEFADPQMPCFGTWVLYHTLRTMIQYVLSGFELELYSVHEYCYIFWYLYEVLYQWLISPLNRADEFVFEQENYAEQQRSRNAKKNKNRNKKRNRVHEREMYYHRGCQQLCGGFYKAMTAFRLFGKVNQPRPEFDSEMVRFNHRFMAFSCVASPSMPSYRAFRDAIDISRFEQQIKLEDFYYYAGKSFDTAKKYFECMSNPNDEIAQLIKVSRMNSILMKLLFSGHKRDLMIQPEFDFSIHKFFPVIKV